MAMSKKRVLAVALLVVLLLTTFACQTTQANSTNYDESQKAYAFLTDVIQLDLSHYQPFTSISTFMMNGIGSTIEVYISLVNNTILPNGVGTAGMHAIFYFTDGHPYFYSLSGVNTTMFYSQEQPLNVLDMSKAMLRRYQAYLTNYCSIDSTYLQPIMDMLNDVTVLASTQTVSGNIQMQISNSLPTPPSVRFKWDYTDYGVDVTRKYVSLAFLNDAISHFSDTWTLYKIGSWSQISEEEAESIAYAAVQNFTFKMIRNNESVEIKPELSNMTVSTMFMAPRENNVLYPVWSVEIFFTEPYGNIQGVHVTISGDTKEVKTVNEFGYSGSPPNGDLYLVI